ncbi:MAG: hypothetical protein ACRD8W_17480 [Nitrososphaeraceae archaeon]
MRKVRSIFREMDVAIIGFQCIICSNLNSQNQGDENNVAIATTTPDSDTNYGAPFP